jgi:hypothetical protein
MRIETNDFAIANLGELTSRYRLFRIKGVRRDHGQYYANLQHIIRRLSFLLRKPVTVIERDEIPYMVVPDDAVGIPTSLSLVRAMVYFEPEGEPFQLDYTLRTPENDEICLRFLQFIIQKPLYDRQDLWQPKSGSAFFKYEPIFNENGIAHYVGFAIRVVPAPCGGLALRVHVANKYIGLQSLPAIIGRNEFDQYRGRSQVYHYGYQWHEVRPKSLGDLNVTEYMVPDDGKLITLLDFVVAKSRKPIPPELAQVPVEGSVIHYLNPRREERAAPSSLCYPVFGANDYGMGRLHKRSLLSPADRRSWAKEFAREYLTLLQFGRVNLQVNSTPIVVEPKKFQVPDMEFGNDKTLSVRGTKGAIQISVESLGETRARWLRDHRIGFYDTDPLDRQYLILPQSVMDSYGDRFVRDLCGAVDALFPQEYGYKPVLITYNDRVKRTLAHQGNAISDAVRAKCRLPGYAVVMIHETTRRVPRKEDQLAAMAVHELRKLSIRAAVIHTTVSQQSYVMINGKNGDPEYVCRHGKQTGILRGYLQNVALNKVLLNNERWPFVLATPLNADNVIGIDVKNNTAGLVVVGNNGERLRSFSRTSRQKEQLTSEQIEKWFKEIVIQEAAARKTPIRTNVIHRDGRVWPSEIEGAQKAIEQLKRTGVIDLEATLTIVEIVKNPQAPLRLFEVSERDGSVGNPQIGRYRIVSETEGYVCTTGREFPRKGTVEPLCVRRVSGSLEIEKCLEDIYCLSALALTRPEDCTRYPITIKLNDRVLFDVATDYDEDALEYGDSLQEQEEDHESDSNPFGNVRGIA